MFSNPLLRLIRPIVGTSVLVLHVSFAQPLTAEQQSWIDSHNAYRAKHQVGNLAWSDEVAQSAKNYASTCPSVHSNTPYGENMAFSSSPQQPSDVVSRWYSEEKLYDYNNPAYQSSTGHFTQVVWKNTTHVGCATVNTCGGSWRSIAVCQYSPAGNFLGRFATNVFPIQALTSAGKIFYSSFETGESSP